MFVTRRSADIFRVYGKRILAFSTISTNPKTIFPHSFLQPSSGLPNHYANAVDGGICLSGFGGKGLRKFSVVSHNEKDEDNESHVGSFESDDNEENENENFSLSETPMWKVVFNQEDRDTKRGLDEWEKQGNVVTSQEFQATMKGLLKRKMFKRAFDVSSWISTKKPFEFDEDYYALHLESILFSQKFSAAQRYLEKIPSSKRGIKVNRVLLQSCLLGKNIRRAEYYFQKMQEMESEMTIKDYNVMLLVYCHCERRKIDQFLESMEASNLKPDYITYRNIIYAKNLLYDVDGMTEAYENMKAAGVKPNADTLAILVRQYTKSGMVAKAEEMLSELEGLKNSETSQGIRHSILRRLLWCYALVKREDDVQKLWKEIEPVIDFSSRTYLAGVSAFGMLGNIGKAEEIFQSLVNSRHNVWAANYNVLLQVYAQHNLQYKAEELLEQISKRGFKQPACVTSTLVELYVNVGELQKADSILSDKNVKPTYHSFLQVLKVYAEKGNIENAERIFEAMRQKGYRHRYGMYEALLHAYVKGKARAHRFEERAKKDGIYLDKRLKDLLKQANAAPKVYAPTRD